MTKKQQQQQNTNHKHHFTNKTQHINNKNQKYKKNCKDQLPTIQNMLEIKKQDRDTKTTYYFKKTQQFIHTYMQKKVGSRVIQLMFKWGNQEVKQSIYKSIVKNWKQLIKSKYALHTISTVSNQFQFPRIVDDAIILQNNKQGSMLISNFILNHGNSPKVQQIINKFKQIQNNSQQKGLQSQQTLHNLAIKSIQKQYYTNKLSKLILTSAIPTMLQQQRQKTLQFLIKKTSQLFHDYQGIKLFICLYNYLNSKQKKLIIKQIKTNIHDILIMNKLSYLILIKIITQTDDTIIINNKIIPYIIQNISDITNPNSNIYHIYISLLSQRNNNLNCLGKIQQSVTFTTCHKQENVRKKQIRSFIYPTLVSFLVCQENILKMFTHANQYRLALGVIKSMQQDGYDQLKAFIKPILSHMITNLITLKQPNSKTFHIQNSLISNNFGSKLIKNILLIPNITLQKYCQKLLIIFKNNLQHVLFSNASFILTVLIQKGYSQLIHLIKKSNIDISKAKAADYYLKKLNAITK